MKKVTLQEACKLLEISPRLIRQWEKKKLIRGETIEASPKLFVLEELLKLQGKSLDPSSEAKFQVLKAEKSTSFSAIELFAGCGGMALGLENAGLQTKLLAEIDRDCVNTLQLNRPHWNVIHDDVAKIDFTPYRDTVDIVAGGFPCQSFSYAGYGKGFEDTRGTLFFEFARCLAEVQPKVAVAENVRGLISHQKGKTLSVILKTLDNLGYHSAYKLLSSQFLDVPQKRERVIIIATRKDLNIRPIYPQENSYTISLKQALQNCPKSSGIQYNSRKKAIMELVPPGGNWRDLPVDLQKAYMKNSFYREGGRTGFAKRLSWNEPALTITCSPAQTQTERCHPEETRPLTIREYGRIQSFPDDWQFTGSISSQYKQIGNAVPVNMAYHIGKCLISMLGDDRRDFQEKFLDLTRQNNDREFTQLAIPGLEIIH
ncbi:MAG: DNA (cytosine-5-)-methyltransferase [Geitlerinemataceae cyanobacterium]